LIVHTCAINVRHDTPTRLSFFMGPPGAFLSSSIGAGTRETDRLRERRTAAYNSTRIMHNFVLLNSFASVEVPVKGVKLITDEDKQPY